MFGSKGKNRHFGLSIEHTRMDCRKLGEHFSLGKTLISNALKDSKNLQQNCKSFKGSCKKHHYEKYQVMREILYKC